MEVWGPGTQTRSFLYIDDCVDAIRTFMDSDSEAIVNIGSEEMISINGLAQMAIEISGRELLIQNIDGPVGVMGRCSDNTLIEKEIGWKPKYSLKQGMKKTMEWINGEIQK
jgi:nucleoside-diphosphate-sugar epimerase